MRKMGLQGHFPDLLRVVLSRMETHWLYIYIYIYIWVAQALRVDGSIRHFQLELLASRSLVTANWCWNGDSNRIEGRACHIQCSFFLEAVWAGHWTLPSCAWCAQLVLTQGWIQVAIKGFVVIHAENLQVIPPPRARCNPNILVFLSLSLSLSLSLYIYIYMQGLCPPTAAPPRQGCGLDTQRHRKYAA